MQPLSKLLCEGDQWPHPKPEAARRQRSVDRSLHLYWKDTTAQTTFITGLFLLQCNSIAYGKGDFVFKHG
jgi:hypothetical protein